MKSSLKTANYVKFDSGIDSINMVLTLSKRVLNLKIGKILSGVFLALIKQESAGNHIHCIGPQSNYPIMLV